MLSRDFASASACGSVTNAASPVHLLSGRQKWVTSVHRGRKNDTGTVLPLIPHLRTLLLRHGTTVATCQPQTHAAQQFWSGRGAVVARNSICTTC
jgi:hypothetical protein